MIPFLIVFALFWVVSITFIVMSVINERKRVEELKVLAEELGLEYVAKSDVPPEFKEFKLFSMGSKRKISNLLHGQADGVSISIFDYHYTTGGGKNKRHSTQTVASIRSSELAICDFSIRPEDGLDQIGSMLGFQDIDFDSHPEFSKKYVLQGKSEAAVRSLFQPAILEYFQSKDRLTLEAAPGTIVVYQNRRKAKSNEIKKLMGEVYEVFGMLADNTFTVVAEPEISAV